jgi:hypothetical protein
MSRKTRRAAHVTAAVLWAVAGVILPLQSTTLQRMSLNQLARAADAVVRARCVGSAARWENGSIWTFDDFEVTERFQGNPPSHTRIRLPGGRVNGISAHIEQVPEFRPGEEAVLFLEAAGDGSYGVTAWAEGTFRIRKTSVPGREFVTQDSSAMAVFDPATRQFHNEGVRNAPWSEFRQQLMSAVSAGRLVQPAPEAHAGVLR